MRQAAKFMFNVGDVDGADLVARCAIHGKDCQVLPPVTKGYQGFIMNIAGVNCYDWSSMGSRMRWLGRGVFPFLAWARERFLGGEQFIVVECVTDFDDELLAEIFEGVFSMTTLRCSPTLFGDPVERRRKYMVLLANGMRWHASITQLDPQEAFEKLFGRKIITDCNSRLRAPAAEIQNYTSKLAAKRGLPATRRSQRSWTNFQVLSPAMKAAVRAHEEHCKENFESEDSSQPTPSILVNLSQRPTYFQSTPKIVPALLRSSLLWSIQQKRLVNPLEYFEIQGHNIFDNDSSQCSFTNVLRELSDRKVRQLAGNSMHLRAVGTVTMYAMACSQRAD